MKQIIESKALIYRCLQHLDDEESRREVLRLMYDFYYEYSNIKVAEILNEELDHVNSFRSFSNKGHISYTDASKILKTYPGGIKDGLIYLSMGGSVCVERE